MSLATSQKHENTYKYCLRLLREFWDWIILEMFLLSFLGLLILLEIFLYFSASSQRVGQELAASISLLLVALIISKTS